jgi:transcriptional regulator with XRE-family HTH domain
MTPSAEQFGSALRVWRTRRRISQLELALRAETTQRHLSYLERGRSVPGRTLVVRLAESLELPLRDRNDLLAAAGYAPLYPESSLSGLPLEPVRHALTSVLRGHEPYPAIVCRRGEVVAANAAFDVLTEDADPRLLLPPINGYRLALHPRGMAPRIGNFPDWAHHVLNKLRETARRTPDPQMDRLVTELEAYVPPASPGRDHVGFAVPLKLRCRDGDLTLISTYALFATAVDVTLTDLRLEAFLPADRTTADILRTRADQRHTTPHPPVVWLPDGKEIPPGEA